jgi:hypothetical protein
MSKKIRFFQFYFDLPSISIILLIIIAIYRPGKDLIKVWLSDIPVYSGFKQILQDFSLNIFSDLIAASLIGLAVFFIFKLKFKSQISGKYKAYDIKTDNNGKIENKTEWGDLDLAFNLFTNRFRGKMTKKDGNVQLVIEASLEKETYLRGTYIEWGNRTTRRAGGFLMMLEGTNAIIKGKYAFVDPDTENIYPQFGEALWEKIKIP